jgi:hypothetical protein
LRPGAPIQRWRLTSTISPAPALRNRWRLVYEIRKIVSVNFFLDCGKQNGFLHGRTPNKVQRKGRQYTPLTSVFRIQLSGNGVIR